MNKHIKAIALLLFIFISNVNLSAQDHLSLYNLGDYVIQAQNLSPAYLPKNSFTFGTPANIGLNIDSNLRIRDLLVNNGGDILDLDLDNLNDVAKENNTLLSDITVNLFALGFKTKKGSIVLFGNLKNNLSWRFTNDFTDVIANGITSGFSLSDEKIGVTAYHEIGIGITRQFLKDKLTIGVRLKSLTGIAHAELEKNASFSLDVDSQTSNWIANSQNATVNTSGIADDGFDDFSAFNENKGIAVDLEAIYKITKKFTLSLAVNDIGQIEWSENVANYNIDDTNNSIFTGIDFKDESLEDAINNWIGTSETNESFKTKLGTKTFLSLKYQLFEKNIITASFFKNNNPFINRKPSYALGYNRNSRTMTYGVIASTNEFSDGVRFGANIAVQLAFLQLYAATNDFSNLFGKVEESNNASLNFGLNFVFGNKRRTKHNIIEEFNSEDLEKGKTN